jgi:hypothetical protein
LAGCSPSSLAFAVHFFCFMLLASRLSFGARGCCAPILRFHSVSGAQCRSKRGRVSRFAHERLFRPHCRVGRPSPRLGFHSSRSFGGASANRAIVGTRAVRRLGDRAGRGRVVRVHGRASVPRSEACARQAVRSRICRVGGSPVKDKRGSARCALTMAIFFRARLRAGSRESVLRRLRSSYPCVVVTGCGYVARGSYLGVRCAARPGFLLSNARQPPC